MVPCALYRGPVCSGAAAQPFHIVVAPAAELIMDFHAHLSTCEVIGILGGTWDQESRTLRYASFVLYLLLPARLQLCMHHQGSQAVALLFGGVSYLTH